MKKLNRWRLGLVTCVLSVSGCVEVPTSSWSDAEAVRWDWRADAGEGGDDIGILDASAQDDSTVTRQPGGFGSGH
jgi:hypothetical protein